MLVKDALLDELKEEAKQEITIQAATGGASLAFHILGDAVALAYDVQRARRLKNTLERFEHAGEFGVDTVNNLRRRKRAAGLGKDVHVHHLIEQRFAQSLGLREGSMKSIVLTAEEHQ